MAGDHLAQAHGGQDEGEGQPGQAQQGPQKIEQNTAAQVIVGVPEGLPGRPGQICRKVVADDRTPAMAESGSSGRRIPDQRISNKQV
jgi:hypothetical protein